MATGLAVAYFYNRDFAAALTQVSRAVELDPSFAEARLWTIGSLIKLGRHEEALQLLEELSEAERLPPLYQAVLAYSFAAVGETGRAEQLLDALESADPAYVSPFWIAVTHGELGQLDEAFEALSAAYDLRDEFMAHLAVSPVVDPLREDPRFTEWVERMAELIGPGPETTH
jgi:tetratricopeptide (TPR) repeat protein